MERSGRPRPAQSARDSRAPGIAPERRGMRSCGAREGDVVELWCSQRDMKMKEETRKRDRFSSGKEVWEMANREPRVSGGG